MCEGLGSTPATLLNLAQPGTTQLNSSHLAQPSLVSRLTVGEFQKQVREREYFLELSHHRNFNYKEGKPFQKSRAFTGLGTWPSTALHYRTWAYPGPGLAAQSDFH